jgi:predicted O-linked N-acetylglucosamine transferase (SPINDLY family)
MTNDLFQTGCEAMASGDYPEAVRLFREIISVNPEIPEVWNNLGIALFKSGSRGKAIETFNHAICLAPSFADAHNNLGHALAVCGSTDEGLAACKKAISINPSFADAYNNAGIILKDLGQDRKALRYFSRACALAPDSTLAWNNRGNAQKELGWLGAALQSYRRALELVPDYADPMTGIAAVHMQRGSLDKAVSLLKRAVELSPFNPPVHSSLIMTMNYSPKFSQAEITEESVFWSYLHGTCADESSLIGKRPAIGRRIRIGYVSADFHRHPVGVFLKNVLKSHDKTAFEITCYQNDVRSDAITSELKRYADRWRIIVGMDDQEAASQIASDGIDILVDLSGHTGGNRLTLFARNPAPIQATWLGYFHTTGLSAMDYIITDEMTVPYGEDHYYSEKVLRLPNCRFCFSPPAPSPFVDSLPLLSKGHVTFGSFNNIAKLTHQVIHLWALILLAVPYSRLVLKWKTFERSAVQKRYLAMFASHGIDPGRIEFRGASTHFLALADYNDIDIALDPFPFNGGLTSCEAMWMGVPVVTLLGTTPIGRQTASFLNAIGLPELIGCNEEHYVEIASVLAGDINHLARLREGLREKMELSPLCDGNGFTRSIENAYRTMVLETSRKCENNKTIVMTSRELCSEYKKADGENAVKFSPSNLSTLFKRHDEQIPQKRLSVCYLVPIDINIRAAALLNDVILLHDRDKVEPIIYYEGSRPEVEAVCQRFTGKLNDYLFARLLCHDSIDVLIDLAQEDKSPQRSPYACADVPVRFGIDDLPLAEIALPLEGRYDHAHLLESIYREKWLDWFISQRKPRGRVRRDTGEKVYRLIEEGRAYRIAGQLEEAENNIMQAIRSDPRNANTHRNLGEVLVFQGRLAEGVASFRRSLQFDPKNFKSRSNLLFTMNYLERYTNKEMLEESLAWGKNIAISSREGKFGYSNTAEPKRRIRIGYVSENFCRHSVSYFFEPLITNHDQKRFEVFCYSCVSHPDETTARIKEKALFWRECAELGDRQIAQMVRDDRIDILVDLAGHSGVRIRLPVFAEKPAPVQVTWLGYPNTTGLSTIDYRITDGIADPEHVSDEWYTEKLVRLPKGFLCYSPADGAPEVGPPPVVAKGYVTFGSFNMLPKLSNLTIDTWVRILKIIPNAHIILKNHSFRDSQTRSRFLQNFEWKGISADRIKLVGTMNSVKEHLAFYGEVDIALDPFPYNGTTTTCEALWMGVPVISLIGERHAGRVGASILQNLFLDDLLSENLEGYIGNVVSLSQNIQRLVDYRAKLRPLMANSSICNGRLFAKNIESAYCEMWRTWCRSFDGSKIQE